MNLLAPSRWFSADEVQEAVGSLKLEIGEINDAIQSGQIDAPVPDDTQRLVWGMTFLIGGLGSLAILILTVVLLQQPNAKLNLGAGVFIGCLIFGIPLATYVLSDLYYGTRAKKRKERRETLARLAEELTNLRDGYSLPIQGPSVGLVPWLATELDLEEVCDLYGRIEDYPIAVVRCEFVVDMTLSRLEGALGSFAAGIMRRVEHEHVHRRELEAIIFLKPIESLPDLYVASKNQPLNWYFKKQFERAPEPATSRALWALCSQASRSSEVLSPRLLRLLSKYKDPILQVIGGHVIFIPQTWDANSPKEMPSNFETVEQNLWTGCDIYDALENPDSVEEDVADERVAAAPSGNPWIKGLNIFGGLLLMGLGGLVIFAGVFQAMQAQQAADWPTTPGIITASTLEEKGDEIKRYHLEVEYEYTVQEEQYTGDEISFGTSVGERNRTKAKAEQAKYAKGTQVDVYYDPNNPQTAVLEPRLADQEVMMAGTVCGATLLVLGLIPMYFGLRKPKE